MCEEPKKIVRLNEPNKSVVRITDLWNNAAEV